LPFLITLSIRGGKLRGSAQIIPGTTAIETSIHMQTGFVCMGANPRELRNLHRIRVFVGRVDQIFSHLTTSYNFLWSSMLFLRTRGLFSVALGQTHYETAKS
jgi:hypothetical protein